MCAGRAGLIRYGQMIFQIELAVVTVVFPEVPKWFALRTTRPVPAPSWWLHTWAARVSSLVNVEGRAQGIHEV